MNKSVFLRCLYLFVSVFVFTHSGKASTKSVWVGQEFYLECNPNTAASQWNAKWTYPNELFYPMGGSTFYKKFKVNQYYEGMANVKCEWEDVFNAGFPGLESSVKRSNSWSITCISNPVSIYENDLVLIVGESTQLHYKHQYENEYTSSAIVSFYCAETDVVSVTEHGEVKAVGEGTAYVYLHSNISGVTPCCTVQVKNANSDNEGGKNEKDDDEETVVTEGSWSDFGAYDIKWYNKTDKSFTISTPKELAGVAYLVNNDITSFKGCTLHVVNDIDLQERYWTPIGRIFMGDIEGNGHIISNVFVDGGYGFFNGTIQDAKIQNLVLEVSVSKTEQPLAAGAFVDHAFASTFENIVIKSNIYLDFSGVKFSSTQSSFSGNVGGFSSTSNECNYKNVKAETNFIFKCGKPDGSSLYGSVDLNIGGIIGRSSHDVLNKCQSVNNVDIEINGYKGDYTNWNNNQSEIRYGGIIGQYDDDKESTELKSCLSKNIDFKGLHKVGGGSYVEFYFGGIVGGDDSGVIRLQNCVALNKNYMIIGHDHGRMLGGTESYFRGVCRYGISNVCYSNNDVEKNIKYIKRDDQISIGNTSSFSMSQMNSQAFVDEINFLNQLEFDEEPCWGLDEEGNLTLLSDEAMSIKDVIKDVENSNGSVYNLQGIEMKDKENLPRGIYISNGKKIYVK